LVITGEGAIDESTAMGKGVGQIAQMAQQKEIPCIGLAGAVTAEPPAAMKQVYAMADLTSSADAMAQPAHWLKALAVKAAEQWTSAGAPSSKSSVLK
jgi:glycerate kinase